MKSTPVIGKMIKGRDGWMMLSLKGSRAPESNA